MKHFFTLSFYLVFPLLLYGQSDRPIAVFLGAVPDQGHIHDDITWVLFVDDVLETDLAVGFITEPAAWVVEGRRAYMGYRDTILIAAPDPDAAIATQHRLDKLEMGLARFAAKQKRTSGFTYQPKASTLSAFEQVKDPAKQWVFRIGANGSIDLDNFKDQNPATGRIGRSKYEGRFNPSFSIWHILPRRRFTTDWSYSYEYTSVDFNRLAPRPGVVSFVDDQTKRLDVNLSWAWGIGKRFALGTSLVYSSYSRRAKRFIPTPPPIFPLPDFEESFTTLWVAPGAEFNVFPYSRFFHEFLIVGYTPVFLATSDAFQNTDLKLNHALYVNSGIIRNWGYLNVQLGYYKDPIQSNDFASTNAWDGSTTLAFNLSKGLLVTFEANLSRSTTRYNYFEASTTKNNSFRTTLGFQYYFGNKGLHIINPRFGRAFNGTSI